jgi:alpha-ribazole phosphatase/probable phosphoglycerate mutase
MATEIVFETHSLTEDNEVGIATGWLPGRLSARGRELARDLGARRRCDRLAAVFSSDLARCVETLTIAFAGSEVPHLLDWRLRECDYGRCNGWAAAEVHRTRAAHVVEPYPGGESWSEAIARVGRFLHDLPLRWDGTRVLLIGHTATRFALDHFVERVPVEDLVDRDFHWRPGWEYRLS